MITIERPDDEKITVKLNGIEIASANYDEHGSAGMCLLENMARTLGNVLSDASPFSRNKLYLAYIDWPWGNEVIGIFSTSKKAQDYFFQYYVGRKFNKEQSYTIDMLNIDEWRVDFGDPSADME